MTSSAFATIPVGMTAKYDPQRQTIKGYIEKNHDKFVRYLKDRKWTRRDIRTCWNKVITSVLQKRYNWRKWHEKRPWGRRKKKFRLTKTPRGWKHGRS